MENKYVSLQNLSTYTDNVKKEIDLRIQQNLYGIVDGTIQTIQNDRALSVRDYGFYKHQSIVLADFPNVTQIGNYSFYQCLSLANVYAPMVTEIGAFAFKDCSSLIAADFLNVSSVGNGVFDGCLSLSSVALTNLQIVSPLMFRKCEDLISIDLPIVTNIKTQAFWSSGITSLILRSNTICTLDNIDAFAFTPIESGTGYIYVPSNLVNLYKTDEKWSTYINQILPLENYSGV